MYALIIFGFIFMTALVMDMVCRPHHQFRFERRPARVPFKPQRGSRSHYNDL